MKPVEFEEMTLKMAEGQEEYQTLPVHVDYKGRECTITSCWELSDQDIEWLVKSRKIYIQQLTFGNAFQPQLPLAYKPLLKD